MKSKRKLGVLLLAGVLAISAFSGCGNAGNTSSQASEVSQSSSSSQIASAQSEAESSLSEETQSQVSDASETDNDESKILVAYFSSAGNIATDQEVNGNIGKGNTKLVAELIREQVGGDLFFIETAQKYSANYRDAIGEARQEQRDNTRPALVSHVDNMDEYDVIFLGYPIWWQALPQPVLTFIEEYELSGKTVIPFCTYEDSGVGSSIKALEEMLPDTTILKEFSVSEKKLKDANEDVKQWLLELDWKK